MGIEADKEEIGSIVWVDRCKFAQDRASAGDHNTSDIGVLWAEDKIAAQAAAIEALKGRLEVVAMAFYDAGYEKGHNDTVEGCYSPPSEYPEDFPDIFKDIMPADTGNSAGDE